MVPIFIILYLVATLAIGLLAGKLVKNSNDFILAGRKLPLLLATTTVFATWFGSETVMGASGEFASGGFLAVIEDPFGASLCLLLVGLFFARPLYRMNLTTFGDFYKVCFGKKAEFIAAIFLIWSYLGWVAAQMVAMGIVLHTVIPEISVSSGIFFSSLVVVAYTYFGGMWAVSITDFFQTIMIIVGLLVTAWIVTEDAGGYEAVMQSAPKDYFQFFPDGKGSEWITWMAALLTLGLGSIPQQDVYQRVMSSRTEGVAVWSSIFAAFMYLTIALIPLYLGMAALKLVPMTADPQLLLTDLINTKTGPVIRIFFFGALLSAIMSTASGALLAPSVILSENILKPYFKRMGEKKFLLMTRSSVIVIALISLGLAFQEKGIYELVGVASEISLVSLFIPLCAGLFFKSKQEIAAVASMIIGAIVWGISSYYESSIPPIFWGTGASLLAFVIALPFEKKFQF